MIDYKHPQAVGWHTIPEWEYYPHLEQLCNFNRNDLLKEENKAMSDVKFKVLSFVLQPKCVNVSDLDEKQNNEKKKEKNTPNNNNQIASHTWRNT